MSRFRYLASPFGAAALALLLASPSSFAETRPANETAAGDDWRRAGLRVERSAPRPAEADDHVQRPSRTNGVVFNGRSPAPPSRTNMRPDDRGRDDRDSSSRNENGRRPEVRNDGRDDRRDRDRDRYDNDRNRQDRDHGRWDGNRGNGRDQSYGHDRRSSHRRPHFAQGRISRVLRHGNGYRIYVHGAAYPFFVPHSHYHRDRFRIGVSIRLGGWYNPGGYYDYYDERSSGLLYGVVESVDYRRGTFVLRNDATGSFVRIDLRDRGNQVRAGDYVELRGEWARHGVFVAYDVDHLDRGYRRY